MGIKLKRFPEYGVTFLVFSGALEAEDVESLCRMLDARDCGQWLSYFDSTVDVSGIDVSHVPELKRVIASRQDELCGGVHRLNAIVFTSKVGEEFVNFWRRYTLSGEVHPMVPAVFADLGAACDWLQLPAAARAIFEAEVGLSEFACPADDRRRERPGGDVGVKPAP